MIYWLGWVLFRTLLRGVGRLQVTGLENVPATGPAILAANHISFADPPTIGASLRRKAWYMGKAELFRGPFMLWLLPRWQAFPVRRGAPDTGALRTSLAILGRGELLCIFPEGTRQPAGHLGPPEMGVGLLALRSGAPVVPVHISGTDRLLPKGTGRIHRSHVRVKFGPPTQYRHDDSRPGREEYQAVANAIMKAIGELA